MDVGSPARQGAPVLRACITSFRTTEADIQWVVDEMNRLFYELADNPCQPSDSGCTCVVHEQMKQ